MDHTGEQAQQHGQGRDVQHYGGAQARSQGGGVEKRGGVTAPHGSRRISVLQYSVPVRHALLPVFVFLYEI